MASNYFERNQLLNRGARDIVIGQHRWTMDPITVGDLLDILDRCEEKSETAST